MFMYIGTIGTQDVKKHGVRAVSIAENQDNSRRARSGRSLTWVIFSPTITHCFPRVKTSHNHAESWIVTTIYGFGFFTLLQIYVP